MERYVRRRLAKGVCLVGLGLVLAGCLASDDRSCECPEGSASGVVVEESREVPAFSHVRLEAPGSLTIRQGPASPLSIRADENLIDRLTSVVDGDTLVLGLSEGCFCSTGEIDYRVSSEQIRGLALEGFGAIELRGPVETDALLLELEGSGEVAVTGPLDAAQLTLEIDGFGSIEAAGLRAEEVSLAIDGDGHVELELEDTNRLRSQMGGFGDLVLTGSADLHEITMPGDGEIDAFGLATATTVIDIGGFGRSGVTVAERLDVDVSGNGEVRYCGQPRVTRSIDGFGEVGRASPDRCPDGI
jgi:hypothetical protein